MSSLIGTLTRPRNEAQVPLVGRHAYTDVNLGALYGGQGNTTLRQLDAMGGVGILFSIVTKCQTAAMRVDWHLYRQAKSGKPDERQEVTSHAALDLWNRPNAFYSRPEFVEATMQHLRLVGETPWLVSWHERVRAVGPLELWPLRPDRVVPIKHPTLFQDGWMYISPDGERIPLRMDEVLRIKTPHPMDPYRGMGAVQTILTELDSSRLTAEWNRAFFRNSAIPGGVVEYDEELEDEEFRRVVSRWREQHQGASNAHRVAIIEKGRWRDRTYSMRDMQFVELRTATRDAVIEAFGIHKATLGITEDVNRAASVAAKALFAEDIVEPDLERYKGLLNSRLLPMFGETARGLEFDHDNPVPPDAEALDRERDSKTKAWAVLVDAGADPDDAADVVGLPRMKVVIPAPPPAPEPPPPTGPPAARVSRPARRPRAAAPPPAEDPDAVDEVDLGPVQAAWEATLAALLASWAGQIITGWIDALVDQIRTILRGDGGRLADLRVPTGEAVDLVADAMVDLAETAAGRVVREAADQDVDLHPQPPARAALEDHATITVELLGRVYELSAAREAQRLAGPGADPADVADRVAEHLDSLSDAQPEQELGAALTAAQNTARVQTLAGGPVGALYASAQMDRNSCGPCRANHGRWIANTDDLRPLHKMFPTGGYVDCEGRSRCRCTVVGVWRPGTEEDAA